MPRPLLQNKGGTKRYKPASSLLSRRNKVLGVGKTIVFDGKMGMRKFGSAALPFGKVACAVKVLNDLTNSRGEVCKAVILKD